MGMRRGARFVFDVEATRNQIRHYVGVEEASAEYVLAQLHAHLPRVRVTRGADALAGWVVASQVWREPSERARLRSPEAAITTLLSSLLPLRGDEALLVRWFVQPSAGRRYPHDRTVTPVSPEQAFRAVGYVAARDADPGRGRALVSRVLSALTSIDRATIVLGARPVSPAMVYAYAWPLGVGTRGVSTYAVPELAVLSGFPAVPEPLVGLPRAKSRQLRPDPAIPQHGLAVGTANFPGLERPVAITARDLVRHALVIGPTGTGKSTWLWNLVLAIIAAGYGLLLIDPKGDLAQSVVSTVPVRFRGRVWMWDPSDRQFPVGLNVLRSGDVERVVAQLVGLFRALFGDSWGPRLEFVLRHALLTAARARLSLYDAYLLLIDSRYRRRVVASVSDPELRAFWDWFDQAPNVADSVINKLDSFVGYSLIRNIVGQHRGGIDVAEVMRNGEVVLAPLAAGLIGERNADALGALLLTEAWNATQGRASLPPERRRPFFVVIDEFPAVTHLPVSLGDALAQARGYGVGFILAAQHTTQLSPELRAAVMANTGSKVVFATGADDAHTLAREFAPDVNAYDLQHLGRYEAIARLLADGGITGPVSIDTPPPPAALIDASDVYARSRARYGRPLAEVEHELATRRHHDRDDRGPAVGRES
jgi:hypothetical protein